MAEALEAVEDGLGRVIDITASDNLDFDNLVRDERSRLESLRKSFHAYRRRADEMNEYPGMVYLLDKELLDRKL